MHQFFCISHFCHTCSFCRVELLVQFPARGSTQVLLCFFPGVLWLCHFLYSVGPHPMSSLHINTFVVSRAFIPGVASQAGDADSYRAPGLISGLQGSVNVHRVDLLLVPQWQCISCFVLYIQYFSLSGVLAIYVMSNSSELHLRLLRTFVFSIDDCYGKQIWLWPLMTDLDLWLFYWNPSIHILTSRGKGIVKMNGC